MALNTIKGLGLKPETKNVYDDLISSVCIMNKNGKEETPVRNDSITAARSRFR
jgi:hypothetical protein